MSNTDATQVTGSSLATDARPGDVLAERYELLEPLDSDGPVVSFRGVDHETERPVLVRILAGEPLAEETLREVLDRLEGLVGVGGRFLSSLLDVDREGRRPFTVEAWPPGTQLSAILGARRVRGEALGPREVLPVIARLNAALGALPDGWPHGDVRAERVWLDTDSLRLTGAFLLSSLPPPLLAERIRALGPGAFVYAPELARGTLTTAADRWGTAALAWEALTGRAPDPSSKTPELPPPLRTALLQLLEQDAARRPRDLSLALRAIAQHAQLPLPELDPESHRPPTADIGVPPADRTAPARPMTRREADNAIARETQLVKPETKKPEARKPETRKPETKKPETKKPEPKPPARQSSRPAPKKIPGAAAEGTQEISFDQIIEEPAKSGSGELDPRLVRAARALDAAPDDTAKHVALSESPEVSDGFDPRLVRAALGITMESESVELAGDSLDPMLVHAALGVTMESSDEQEVTSSEIQLDPEPATQPGAPMPAPTPRSSRPPAAKLPPPKPAAPKPAARPPSAAKPDARPKVAPRPPTARAQPAVLPAPAPRPQPAVLPAPRPQPGPDPSADLFAPPPSQALPEPPKPRPISERPPAPPPRPISERPEAMAPPEPRRIPSDRPTDPPPEPGTQVVQRPAPTASPAPRPRRSMAGVWIVLAATFIALVIVGAGFVIARMRAEDARERQIQERLRQLRDSEDVAVEPATPVQP